MKTLLKILGVCLIMSLFSSACSLQVIQSESAEGDLPKAVAYQSVLGKSLNDKDVTDFITTNCSPANQFQLCNGFGIALWTNADQIVKTVWLYSSKADGFERYRGDLPYGLSFYDPMWRVIEKLSIVEAADGAEQIAWLGLPDETSSPDRVHYWASYKRLGMTVIYDSPGADEDAYIYAILVHG